MKKDDIQRAYWLTQYEKEIENMVSVIGYTKHGDDIPVNMTFREDPEPERITTYAVVNFNRRNFLKFLDGEMQAINLELYNLGIDLPEVQP